MHLNKDKEKKLYELFISLDDFCKSLDAWKAKQGTQPSKTQVSELSESEIMTIFVFYHYSAYKCFQYYYEEMVLLNFKSYFPKAISYSRFLTHILKILAALYVYSKYCTLSSRRTNIYFIDSKKLPVCHYKRRYSNRSCWDWKELSGLVLWFKTPFSH